MRQPLLNVRLYGKPVYLLASMLGWVAAIAFFGVSFLLPLYLQTLRGRTPFQAGLLLLPQAAAAVISVAISGRLYDRIGPRWVITTGVTILAISTIGFVRLSETTSYRHDHGLARGAWPRPRLRIPADAGDGAFRGRTRPVDAGKQPDQRDAQCVSVAWRGNAWHDPANGGEGAGRARRVAGCRILYDQRLPCRLQRGARVQHRGNRDCGFSAKHIAAGPAWRGRRTQRPQRRLPPTAVPVEM